MSLKDGLMNKLVLIFLLANLEIIFLILYLFFFKFKPPSVVISFLFSGTIQTKSGFNLSAVFTISEFVEISKFTKRFLIEQIFLNMLHYKYIHQYDGKYFV